MSKIDLAQLRWEIQNIKSSSPLANLLKEELPKIKRNLWLTDIAFFNLIHEYITIEMKRWQDGFRIIRDDIKARGNWKDKPRGDPHKGFKVGMGKNDSRKIKRME